MAVGVSACYVYKQDIEDAKRCLMLNRLKEQLYSEGCGICEKEGYGAFWISDYSFCAHRDCYMKIIGLQNNVNIKIQQLFQNVDLRAKANIIAISAVKAKLGGTTLGEFFDTKGPSFLQRIFDTVGVWAVEKYELSLNQQSFVEGVMTEEAKKYVSMIP